MLTVRAAASLLAGDGLDALAAIAAACGCGGPLLPLDEPSRAAIGVPAGDIHAVSAHVARGAGALRTLVVRLEPPPDQASARDVVLRIAARLARRAPHLAWLCIAATRSGAARSAARHPARELVLASWWPDRSPPRVAALAVDQDAVVDSDAETLCALVPVAGFDDALTHARWLDVLGREALTRRFYRALRRAVQALAAAVSVPAGERRPAAEDRHRLALLYASRLLFLAFLEAKGWLDDDRAFLARTFTECVAGGGAYHRRVLRPLFFGTLNTPRTRRAAAARRFGRVPFLNGGLFAPTPLEGRFRHAAFADDALGALLADVLGHYRFTAREDRSTWSEAAVDPEMLGKAFEALMAPEERHRTGAYYTPQDLVELTARRALRPALAGAAGSLDAADAALDGAPAEPALAAALRARVAAMRVLDPACGSGAFLVHVLEVLATLVGRMGDPRPLFERRRALLTRSIFGVDVNPTAVWLCELRLWLAVVVDCEETDPDRVAPLPNLDRNVRVGDALTGGSFDTAASGGAPAFVMVRAGHRIRELRERYARAAGPRKRAAARALERAERARAVDAVERELMQVEWLRRDVVSDARARDLFGGRRPPTREASAQRLSLRRRVRSLRARLAALRDGAALPFAFAAHFSDAEADGGFDVVVGNPPWVRPHALRVADREWLREAFAVCREAAWARGTAAGRAGGFGSQVDLSALFLERSLSLARPGGIIALLLPAKLWRCLAGGGVRQLVSRESTLLEIEDWSTAGGGFDAAVYPSLLVARRIEPRARDAGSVGVALAADPA